MIAAAAARSGFKGLADAPTTQVVTAAMEVTGQAVTLIP